jgi:hypothetical protein
MDQTDFHIVVKITGVALLDSSVMSHIQLSVTQALADCLRDQSAKLHLEHQMELSQLSMKWERHPPT